MTRTYLTRRRPALLAERIGRDFDDTLQHFVAKKLGAEAIVSFDRHFDGLDLARIEPGTLNKGVGRAPVREHK